MKKPARRSTINAFSGLDAEAGGMGGQGSAAETTGAGGAGRASVTVPHEDETRALAKKRISMSDIEKHL